VATRSPCPARGREEKRNKNSVPSPPKERDGGGAGSNFRYLFGAVGHGKYQDPSDDGAEAQCPNEKKLTKGMGVSKGGSPPLQRTNFLGEDKPEFNVNCTCAWGKGESDGLLGRSRARKQSAFHGKKWGNKKVGTGAL